MSVRTGQELSTWQTLRRGFALSPELRRGVGVTIALAVVSTLGRILVPIAVQQTIDRGILAAGGPDPRLVTTLMLVTALGVVLAGCAAYLVNLRLFRSSEGGLATLRITGFRHLHDLSMLTQNAERRGALVARVTTDVDQISQFVQFSGLMLLMAVLQLLVASALMLVYSPPLALVVWLCFLPLAFVLRTFQGMVGRAYTVVRERVGDMLAAISESVVGAATIRAYGVQDRTAERIDRTVEAHRRAAVGAQIRAVGAFTAGQFVAGMTTMIVLLIGTVLATHGRLTLGELLAFLFIVNLFTQPVQTATENLNELQNAVAGWRRVIGLIDTPADVRDPGDEGVDLPRGPITVDFDGVRFGYPGGVEVLHGIDLHIGPRQRVAIVGETGSGKTTLAKLLTRLMDASDGEVRLDGVDIRRIRFSSLRSRVVLVPQEGFLFDDTLAANLRFGAPEATDDELHLAITELGLDAWLATLPHGLQTRVGQRGESLSAGERQLVALARAYLADPDLLLLDEATSAVDPATEVRIQRALESLTSGRTSIAIAHRLSTAEAADLVVVVDRGQIVQLGPHRELVQATGSVYARLHASWATQQTH
ncbi:ABC transporter ATP-binding protein [Calidifontibacter sp. DB0510]|uniref:ABC transporter ATP-binding protein n=1 Tax=Metallococcus carri TaxID=1656884 RepID=A0A967AYY6_9MICO|nr:ABC transporter ATP-binding protein [Metallococcus carri]NHN54984.1 ABC transporter ATP-binding protein [Metallococcus carri]NOP37330.1 ABC transporter ATP-binding protein [Calidifontibacter sp. DB2511S]